MGSMITFSSLNALVSTDSYIFNLTCSLIDANIFCSFSEVRGLRVFSKNCDGYLLAGRFAILYIWVTVLKAYRLSTSRYDNLFAKDDRQGSVK